MRSPIEELAYKLGRTEMALHMLLDLVVLPEAKKLGLERPGPLNATRRRNVLSAVDLSSDENLPFGHRAQKAISRLRGIASKDR